MLRVGEAGQNLLCTPDNDCCARHATFQDFVAFLEIGDVERFGCEEVEGGFGESFAGEGEGCLGEMGESGGGAVGEGCVVVYVNLDSQIGAGAMEIM